MSSFILYSLMASVVLTLALNLIPQFFPNAFRNMMDGIEKRLEEQHNRLENGERPRVQVFFPWKTMIMASIILTIFLNLATLLK